MAIGDIIPTELVQTALTATAANYITNVATNRTQILQIWLCNTGATQRTVTLYKNGLGAVNQIGNSIVLPANGSAIIDTKLVSTGTQTFGAKQDTGTDISMTVCGIVEQIA